MSVDLKKTAEDANRLKQEVGKLFVGQEELVDGCLAALFAGGHVLIEGVPGLGKTLLVRLIAKIVGVKFSRIQVTPDLMPSDITGSHIYNQSEQKFSFIRGPVFTNLLLADEINRAPAKTHSALLEIMQEFQVSLDNKRYVIPPPFFVLATQNPVESEGTYALPEAQLDRFLLKLLIDYPTESEEKNILSMHASGANFDHIEDVEPVLDQKGILELIAAAEQIRVSDPVLNYINSLVRATRTRRDIYLGCSPRAGIAVLKTARVTAMLDGRDYVIPDDIKRMTPPAFRHRILLTPEAEVEGSTPDMVIEEVLQSVEVPREG